MNLTKIPRLIFLFSLVMPTISISASDEIVAFSSAVARADIAAAHCKDIKVNEDALKQLLDSLGPTTNELAEINNQLIPEWSEAFNTLMELKGPDAWCRENIPLLTTFGNTKALSIITER